MSELRLSAKFAIFGPNVWFYVLDPEDYKSKVQPSLRQVIRSRGAHSPGSGNYCYGACTVHDATARVGNDWLLMPGGTIRWSNSDDTERYWADWKGDTIYYLNGVFDGERWHYRQCMPSVISFLYFAGSYRLYNQVVYRVPDNFTSKRWISPLDFPWVKHGGSGYNYVSTGEIVVRYTPYDIGRELWSFMDSFTLAYSPWINEYLSLAYVDAISHAPMNRVNNVQNVFAFCSAFMKVVEAPYLVVDSIQSLKDFKDMASDIWLAYRYSLTTTVMDVSELVDYAYRSSRAPQKFKCHGFVADEHDGDQYEFRCSVSLLPNEVNSLQSDIEKLGLGLSAYNAWDMVPYSFIADWFLHIGDRLEFYDDRNRAMRLGPTGEIWYSVVRRHEDEKSSQDFYFRWSGGVPSYSPTFVRHGDAKTGTIIKRVADVIALV